MEQQYSEEHKNLNKVASPTNLPANNANLTSEAE